MTRRGMAAILVRAGYPATVWNRSAEKRGPPVMMGPKEVSSPSEAAADEDGILAGARSEPIIVDLSAVCADSSQRGSQAGAQRGVEWADAAVSGSKGEARQDGLWRVAEG